MKFSLKLMLRTMVRSIVTLAIALVLVFVALRLSGDPAVVLLPPDTSAQVLQEATERWGLNQPMHVQFFHYVQSLASGNLGQSYVDGQDVSKLMYTAMLPTLLLAACAFFLTLTVGVTFGCLSALLEDTAFDKAAVFLSVAIYSIPSFFSSLLFIWLLSAHLQLLPAYGGGSWKHLILPTVMLSSSASAILFRMTRSAVVETIQKPFIEATLTFGVSPTRVLIAHVLPNVSIVLLTICGLLLGTLLGGTAVTEIIFGWPGMGSLFVSSVGARDLPVVQAVLLFMVGVMVTVNLLVDILYQIVDPRVADEVSK